MRLFDVRVHHAERGIRKAPSSKFMLPSCPTEIADEHLHSDSPDRDCHYFDDRLNVLLHSIVANHSGGSRDFAASCL